MSDLRKYTLSHDPDQGDWVLTEDGADRATRRFETKSDALEGGALAEALSREGGSVKIQNQDGTFAEERTFPRSKDPTRSPG